MKLTKQKQATHLDNKEKQQQQQQQKQQQQCK